MSTGFISKVNYCSKSIQYLLLPGTCIVCDRASERELDLCLDCESCLLSIDSPCLCCGLPLPVGNYAGQLCGACISKPPPYAHITSAFAYADPVRQLISAFKYRAKLAYGRVLTRLLQRQLQDFYQQRLAPDLLIPMPLHGKRLRERGFNQALEIARPLSRAFDIPVDYKSIYRQRHTAKQEGLNIKERLSNLHAAFACREPVLRLPDRVAIIDDVVTTTASTQALCKVLLRHGAEEIHIWSLARASLKN